MTTTLKKNKEFISGFQENIVSDISSSEYLSLEEGEISDSPELKKENLDNDSPELKKENLDNASYESLTEEEIQWSGLQILMAGDERVIDYNWKYLKIYPNQHFFHLANANLRSLCSYIDKQINREFDVILIFAFHYDFAYMQYDEKYGFDDLLLAIRSEVQFEELIKTVNEFHGKWEKLNLCHKIVWILPSAINFYKYNLSLIKHSKTLTAKSLNENEYHEMSKKYYEYSQKLCEHWRKSLKTIPFLPLNDILFSKKYKYQDSFIAAGPPKFPEGFQVDGFKPTALMSAYLAYYLTKLMHDKRFFPLITCLPKLKDTEARVIEKDIFLEKYIHEYSKKRKSSSHHRYHKRSRKHRKQSSESSENDESPSFNAHSTIAKKPHRRLSHSRTKRRHRDNSESQSSSQSCLNKRKYSKTSTKSRSSSRSCSRSRNIDYPTLPGEKNSLNMDMSETVQSVSEEVEFYRKLACLREVHDIQCNSYRCHSTSHPSYNEEKIKFFSGIQDSDNYSYGNAAADWDNYWKDKLEELFKLDWETKKKLLILKLQSKITEKKGDLKETLPNMLKQNILLNKDSIVSPVNINRKIIEVEPREFNCDEPARSSFIDLTQTSPLRKEKQKINIKDYIRMQKIHHDIELKEEIQQFILTSNSRSEESISSVLRSLNSHPTSKSFTPKSSPCFNYDNFTSSTPKSPNFTPNSPIFTSNSPAFALNSPTYTPNSPTFNPNSPTNTFNPDSPTFSPNCSNNVSNTKSIATLKNQQNDKINLELKEFGKNEKSGKQVASPITDTTLTSSFKKEKPKIKFEDYLRMQKVHRSNESNIFEIENCDKLGESVKSEVEPPKSVTRPENLHIAAKNDLTQSSSFTSNYTGKESFAPISPAFTPSYSSKSSPFTPSLSPKSLNFIPTCSTSTTKCLVSSVKIPTSRSNPNDSQLNSSDSECFPNDSDSDMDIDQLMGNTDFLEGLKEIDEELRKSEFPVKSSCTPSYSKLEKSEDETVNSPLAYSLPPEKQLPKAIVPPKIISLPKTHLPKAIVSPNCSFPTREIFLPQTTLKEKLLPKATISPLREKLSESLSFQDADITEKVPLKDRDSIPKNEIGIDYVNILKMLFRLSRHLGSLGLSITALYNAAITDPRSSDVIPDDDAKTILTLVNRKINSLLNEDLSQVQRAIFEEVSGKLKKLLDNLNLQNDKFNNINIKNIASATVGQTVSQIISFIKNTLLYHGYADFESKDVMNLYMSVKAAHSNMGSCT